MMDSDSDAYWEGIFARDGGIPRRMNPYQESTEEGKSWFIGWDIAERSWKASRA